MQSRAKLHLNFGESRLEGIQACRVDETWHLVADLLQPAIDRMGGTHDAHDIKKALVNRDMQLWVSWRDQKIEAALVTEICVAPHKKVCRYVLVGGSYLKNWVHFDKELSQWAKAQGCCRMFSGMRPGFAKELEQFGWQKDSVNMVKELGNA